MKNILFVVSFLTSYSCLAELKLPSIFSHNMMLQQSENVAIWGNDIPNAKISVSGS